MQVKTSNTRPDRAPRRWRCCARLGRERGALRRPEHCAHTAYSISQTTLIFLLSASHVRSERKQAVSARASATPCSTQIAYSDAVNG